MPQTFATMLNQPRAAHVPPAARLVSKAKGHLVLTQLIQLTAWLWEDKPVLSKFEEQVLGVAVGCGSHQSAHAHLGPRCPA